MDKRKEIEIPDNASGQLLFDVLHRLAVKLCEAADEATRDFMLANFPAAQTIRKDYVNRQYRRIIEVDGESYAVIYDFKTQTTAAAQGIKKRNHPRSSGKLKEQAGRGGNDVGYSGDGVYRGVLWTGFCALVVILYQGWRFDREMANKEEECRERLREKEVL